MRLVRLEIENFGAIAQANLSFGSGLNVLYGPNDLGKSTLAEAVRLALLLPSTSTVHEAWVPWSTAQKPTVDLEFWSGGLFWKVRKEFGAGNKASLRKSSDGTNWDEVAKARAVDGKLREILQWGIPEPGGATAPRGLPTSFLATALLSTQADVGSVLAASFEGDTADTGKQRVAEALSALAQDPLFKKLLDATNERYDEAFTAQGRKKQAADGVLKLAADRVRIARVARDEAQKVVNESAGVQQLLTTLIARRDVGRESVRNVREKLDSLLALRTWARAKSEVDRIAALGREVEQAGADVQILGLKRDASAAALGEAEHAHVAATDALAAAEEEVRAAAGDSQAAELAERQRCELAIADADRRLADATRAIEAARLARKAVADAEAAKAAAAEARARIAKAEEELAAARQAGQGARDEAARLELVERYLDLREASETLARVETLRSAVVAAEARVSSLTTRRAMINVPKRGMVKALRELATELEVARGKLAVGLAVTVEPVGSQAFTVTADGTAKGATSTVEARGQVEVVLDGVATVRIVAGSADARAREKQVFGRWVAEAAPVLKAAGVVNVEALATLVDEADQLDRDIAAATQALATARADLDRLDADEARVRADEAREALGDTVIAESEVAGRDPRAAVRARWAALTKVLDQSKAPALETAVALARERAATADQRCSELEAARDLALSAHGDDLSGARAQADAARATVDAQAARANLAGIEKAGAQRAAANEAKLAGARKRVTEAAAKVADAKRAHQAAIAAVATREGEHRTLTARLAEVDRARAQAELETAAAALGGTGRAVSDAEIAAATSAWEREQADLDRIGADLHRAQGALEQVGGAIASERLRDTEEALRLAEQQERDIEAEYEAWRLLRQTMVEAEAAQASHLGQALAPVVGERFSALTGSRYGGVAMTAHLGTEGVRVNNLIRPVDRLSIGTRDQLSTLYRLSLAERLGSTVMLDDQLVHSDKPKLEWFRALLREKANLFQIVVLTCRIEDYVPSLTPSDDAWRDVEPKVRVVNLPRVMRRG